MVCIFFVKYTATTEIYTYVHTLSLHDALPILFLVSHDRAFLENTVTHVIAFEGNGVLTEFGGGYDDWWRFSEQRALDKLAADKAAANKPAPAKPTVKSKPGKLSFQETRELEELRSEEHTSELQSLMRSSYDVFCLTKKQTTH